MQFTTPLLGVPAPLCDVITFVDLYQVYDVTTRALTFGNDLRLWPSYFETLLRYKGESANYSALVYCY